VRAAQDDSGAKASKTAAALTATLGPRRRVLRVAVQQMSGMEMGAATEM
jgi:hypothetical protein